MRVLVLATDAYGGHGGIALYMRDFVAAIASHPGVEEVVVLPRVIRGDTGAVPPRVRFAAAAARGKVDYMRALRSAARERFDLTICGHINLLPLARLTRTPTALMLYGIEAWKPSSRVSAASLRDVVAAISISDVTLQRFRSWSAYAGPSFILPNAIHLDAYGIRPKRDDLLSRWNLHGKTVLLTLGRIEKTERYKGFDEVLEILPDLLRERSDIVYVIAGSGSDVAHLRAKAAALGVAGAVVFTGFVDEREKPDLYNLADLYVMPSRGEGFGFVFLEALACGVPAIGSRHDGGREALRDGALGMLVDPSNGAELRTAILDALALRTRKVPEGLAYFAFEEHQRRVHAFLDDAFRHPERSEGSRATQPEIPRRLRGSG